ncbi:MULTISPECIES: HEPN family nuclease [unclassified Fusibacter]|uniref:HEPN family nuclease n=1 Tax=unclassified Fusibacter TaxID=2624464 RepID=UPI001010372B|nr:MULTISPECIES: HEPN family nuclease [unclassified Fusibacter]MCK8059721.1 HEPN family nuclease [Fusibacter sp. A2]NPE21522.1 hypothetical protein [Fusibacter sp. A1]RXV61932.1 hypothetical protein DWB64_06745 [Fusibacter sp. A1]
MEYKHFGYDFIERTTELIKSTASIYEKYDVTYLLNCCFGLITIPRETMIKQIPKIDLKTAQFGEINVEKISKS